MLYAWLIIAGILIIIEMLTLSLLALFFSAGAILVALMLWLLPETGFLLQVGIFAVLTVMASLFWFKFFYKRSQTKNDVANDINLRGRQHIGQTCVVFTEITANGGKVKVGDTLWAASAADVSETPIGTGQTVVITDASETFVTVSKAK